MNNKKHSFIGRCLSDSLDGLRDGLSHFSGTSRVAVLYCITPESPLLVCDPQNLLQGHGLGFSKQYLESDEWRYRFAQETDRADSGYVHPERDLQLSGLVSYGGHSNSVYYQRWFTEHHPDMCSTCPTKRWLEHAAWRFSHDISKGEGLYTGISGYFLREYATHAVRDHIVDEMNLFLGWDSQVRIYPVLDAILGISKTREEGVWPEGELIIIDPQYIGEMNFLVRFREEERPQLGNFKHVRKLLLTVEQTDYKLLSDGKAILGIISDALPEFSLSAKFFVRHGFLGINKQRVCSFSDGSFHSTTHLAKLVELEEALIDSNLSPSAGSSIYKIVASLVHYSQHRKHGCTLVVDLNREPVKISGQTLSQHLDLRQPDFLELAKSLTKLDGALHIGMDSQLYGFACLLDGRKIHGEDRARGARYNSALRFTAEHDNIIVVVVSVDRPVSIIQEGVEISGICQWRPITSCIFDSEPLASWVNK
ncbi:MAG: DNA integrity scanning protein DisA nucleotide-binding domain protein [Desulfobulbaceae bacterium]|nr:DNA integrity scanning protein DisA nucleotide-binding domain protein [Desulfobulbaceae bacterium]